MRVEETENGLRIYPAECIKPCKIKTYDDHRVAMSFTLPGLKAEGVEIIDPYCCRKTLRISMRYLRRVYINKELLFSAYL